jgi:hypothetical protein
LLFDFILEDLFFDEQKKFINCFGEKKTTKCLTGKVYYYNNSMRDISFFIFYNFHFHEILVCGFCLGERRSRRADPERIGVGEREIERMDQCVSWRIFFCLQNVFAQIVIISFRCG